MMAANQPPGGSDFLLPALSLPMKEERSRNKERLEASLAGLCELELLKQRQESRVLGALRLGDALLSGRSPWGQLRSALCSLDAPKDAGDRRHQTVGRARGRCAPSAFVCALWKSFWKSVQTWNHGWFARLSGPPSLPNKAPPHFNLPLLLLTD